MAQHKILIWLQIGIFSLILAWTTGCGSGGTPTPAPPTATAVASATNTPTSTPPPTWTPTSTSTPTLTPTAEPTPTASTKRRIYHCDEIVDISLASDETGWAVVNCWASVGNRAPTTGFVYRLMNDNWHLVSDAPDIAGPYACYTGVSAVSDNEMWAIGLQDGVYVCQDTPWLIHYLDGEWEVVDIAPNSSYHTGFHSIEAVDAENIWVGGRGVIFKYEKGTWKIDLELSAENSGMVRPISFSDVNTGWAWVWRPQGGIFLQYQNHTWAVWQGIVFDEHTVITSIDSVSDDEAWAVGYREDSGPGYFKYIPQLWHYVDNHWREVRLPIEEGYLQSIKMINHDEGWITGGEKKQNTVLLHYTQNQWEMVSSPTDSAIFSVDATTLNNIWLGADRFYHHSQTGDWQPVNIISTVE